MTQPFGSCDIWFSASLALAAPATNVATAPRQVASSNLRITKPPTLFQVLFCLRTGVGCVQRQRLKRIAIPKVATPSAVASAIDSQKTSAIFQLTEIELKPETTKCYARHPERATEIKFCNFSICCDAIA